MTTQSLRGMANHGPMHWRGDRTGGNDAPSAQPDSGTFDEDAAFKKFNVGVRRLLGRSAPLTARGDAGVHRLHPAGHLSAEPDPQPRQLAHRRPAGGRSDFFLDARRPIPRHVPQLQRLPRARSARQRRVRRREPGFFGTDGRYALRGRAAVLQGPAPAEPVPEGRHVRDGRHLRSGEPRTSRSCSCRRRTTTTRSRATRCAASASCTTAASTRCSASTPAPSSRSATPTNLFPNPGGIPVAGPTDDPATAQQKVLANIQLRRQIEAFMLAFDSNLAPDRRSAGDAGGAGRATTCRRGSTSSRRARGGRVRPGRPRAGPRRAVGFLYDPATARFIPDRAPKRAGGRRRSARPRRRRAT